MLIVIRGNPLPKKRHRSFFRGNRICTYDPQVESKKIVEKAMYHYSSLQIDDIIDEKASNLPVIEHYHVIITFYMQIPESFSKAKKSLSAWNLELHGSKPDLDNLAKFYLDAGNGILWEDDRKISKLILEKKYSHDPRVEIEVKAMKEQQISEEEKIILELFSPEMFNDLIDKVIEYAIEEEESFSIISKILQEFSKYHREFSAINRRIKAMEPKNVDKAI